MSLNEKHYFPRKERITFLKHGGGSVMVWAWVKMFFLSLVNMWRHVSGNLIHKSESYCKTTALMLLSISPRMTELFSSANSSRKVGKARKNRIYLAPQQGRATHRWLAIQCNACSFVFLKTPWSNRNLVGGYGVSRSCEDSHQYPVFVGESQACRISLR